MKKIVKDFIPPVIANLFKRGATENSYRVFSDYAEALKSCTVDAYEDRELVEVIYKKTKRYSEHIKSGVIPVSEINAYSIISIINPIIESADGTINVLDFGGAAGAHYFLLRNLVDRRLKINWAVVETPAMVGSAKQLQTDELFFFDNFEDAVIKLGYVDLVHTSGALQCVDNPMKYLDSIIRCNSKWIAFSRLGLNKLERDVVTVHSSQLSRNGIGELPDGYTDRWVKYPMSFLSEKKFIQKLEEKYCIVAKFIDQSGMHPVDGEEITGYGLLCKQKSSK